MLKQLLLLLPFSFLSISLLLGQSEKEKDSLVFLLKYAEPIEKIEIVKDYSHKFYKTSPEEVDKMLDELLEKSDLSVLDSVHICYLKSVSSYYLSDLDGHISYHELTEDILKRYKGPKNVYYYHLMHYNESINAIHAIHSNSPGRALDSYLLSAEYAEKSKRPKNILRGNLALGSYYIEEKEHPKAFSHLNKCLNLDIEKNEEINSLYFKVYTELAFGYVNTNRLDSAEYFLKLIPADKYKFSTHLAYFGFLEKNGQNLKANRKIDSLINNIGKGHARHWLPFLKMQKGDNLYAIKEYERAETAWLESRLGFLEMRDNDNLANITNRLYEYYKKRGRFEKALVYHEENKMINDSMLFQNHTAVLQGIKDSHKLESEKQTVLKLKERATVKNLIIQRQRILGGLGLVLTALLGVFAYIYFKIAKTKRLLNDELKKVNSNLESRNKEIKTKADELSFISENLPEGIGRLDKDLKLSYYNRHLTSCLLGRNESLDADIFQLLQYSSVEQNLFKQDLEKNGELSITWFCEEAQEIYQVQIVKISSEEESQEYLVVMQDVTELKKKEDKKMSVVEAALQTMKDNEEQNYLERQALNSSLFLKNKELVASMMQISKRNSEIEEISENLKKLYRESNSTSKLKLSKIINQVNATLDIEDSWLAFNTYFKEIHPTFLTELRKACDTLSHNEVRHCTFIKLGLSNKEVADMLKVSTKTVEVARYRIKKKLNLGKEQSLYEFINNLVFNDKLELVS